MTTNLSYLSVMSKYLGDYVQKKDENYAFTCPFCNHYKKKLEVDVKTGLWSCWVCRKSGKRVSNLLKKVHINHSDLQYILSFESYDTKKYNTYKYDYLTLPDNFIRFEDSKKNIITQRLLKYLASRNISADDIIKHKIGYLDNTSANSIIIPSYDDNFDLNFYVEKNIITGRYVNPEYSKNQVIFESFISWDDDVIFTEGVFDAMTIRRNAVPLLGKTLNERLKLKIIESSSQNFYIALDGGEIKDTITIAKYIMSCGKNAYYVDIPIGEDASSIGYKKIWELINNATLITQDDIFMYELSSKL
jgi:ribosomal protein L37AE/L43A